MDVRVVAFDLDCTLVDIVRAKERAAEAAAWTLVDAGLDADAPTAAREILDLAFRQGLDADGIVEAWLATRCGADAGLARRASRAFERAEAQASVAYPRAARTLRELAQRGYLLALVTDAPRRFGLRRLRAAGLAPFFPLVVTREDTPRGKAGREPFDLLAARAGVAPSRMLMVGDNPRLDVGSARAAGLRTALAEYGLRPQLASSAPEHAPDVRLRWIDDLLDVLPGGRAAETEKAGETSYVLEAGA